MLIKLFSACLVVFVNSSFTTCCLSRFRNASAYWQQMLNKSKNFQNQIHWATCLYLKLLRSNSLRQFSKERERKNVLYQTSLFSETRICKAQIENIFGQGQSETRLPWPLEYHPNSNLYITLASQVHCTIEDICIIYIYTYNNIKNISNYVFHFKPMKLS